MAVKDVLRRLIGYRLSGGGFTEMAIPPGWNYQAYLNAYGEIGWLFGAVSLIANSVASSEWILYRKNGNLQEIDKHPLIDLWNHVNPFQTRYQFLLQLETYIELIGEAFIVLNFNKLSLPAEMWLASPSNMSIMPSSDKYISHYEYAKGNTKLRLEIPEVIHIFNPNPANPYRGIGAAKSISNDLDSEIYAAKYQNKLFYNDATPRLFLEFPDLPPIEERKRLRDEFLDIHQGWRNAYKPGFLWGGAKANTISMTSKDMDFANLRNVSKKLILAAYHIPESLIGASEIGSRARAEADEYVFAKYTIKPALQRIREALNEQLCPLYDDNIMFDFKNPVPEDSALIREQNRQDFQAGIITREEARTAIGMDIKADGTFILPFSVLEVPAKFLPSRTKNLTSEQKDALWRDFAVKTETEEKWFISELKYLWADQQDKVIQKLKNASTPDEALFSKAEADIVFNEAMLPILTKVFDRHFDEARELIHPHNPHTESKDLNDLALLWLRTRSLRLAKLLNGTTIEQLRETLTEGFEAGESVAKLADRVIEYYGQANKVRAAMVARTETIAASVEGNLQGYENLGVEKVQWYTALDDRTCDTCGPRHDEEFPVKETHELIPAHPNCRCVFIPMI